MAENGRVIGRWCSGIYLCRDEYDECHVEAELDGEDAEVPPLLEW